MNRNRGHEYIELLLYIFCTVRFCGVTPRLSNLYDPKQRGCRRSGYSDGVGEAESTFNNTSEPEPCLISKYKYIPGQSHPRHYDLLHHPCHSLRLYYEYFGLENTIDHMSLLHHQHHDTKHYPSYAIFTLQHNYAMSSQNVCISFIGFSL